MKNFGEIISRWESAEVFASDVGVQGVVARQWRRRNNIPAQHWRAVINAAQGRGFSDITGDLLTDLASRDEAA